MAEEMDPNAMGDRPPMPAMDGANMQNPASQMPPEAVAQLMKPSEEIAAVLMARISNMDREDLVMLDQAITPEVARVMVKLLPELGAIISQVGGQAQAAPPQEQMGALGDMG